MANPKVIRILALSAALAMAGQSAHAQDNSPPRLILPENDTPGEASPPDGGVSEGMDLLGQGIDMLLRGLVDEIGPELQRITPELRDFAEGMGPMLQELAEMMGEINAYHAPEMLPNGDILLRRKTPEELERPPVDPPEGEQIDI